MRFHGQWFGEVGAPSQAIGSVAPGYLSSRVNFFMDIFGGSQSVRLGLRLVVRRLRAVLLFRPLVFVDRVDVSVPKRHVVRSEEGVVLSLYRTLECCRRGVSRKTALRLGSVTTPRTVRRVRSLFRDSWCHALSH